MNYNDDNNDGTLKIFSRFFSTNQGGILLTDFRSHHGTPITWHPYKFQDLEFTLDNDRRLGLEEGIHIKDVTSGLDFVESESAHGFISLVVPALAHVPSRRFRAHEYEAADYDGRKHRRGHHKTPAKARDAGSILDGEESKICRVTHHDSESGPELPLHHKSTTNRWWGGLCCIDRYGRRFGSDTEAKGESGDEHRPPGIAKALPEACSSREEASDEDSTATSKDVVERFGQPAAYECTAKVRASVEQSRQPSRSLVLAVNTELYLVKDLCAVDDGLI